ncbi:TRAP transporter large permease subunit [Thiohalocapsa marina]|uniref:TRAP transporter large permease subunit n=1 Tax=Thiohalocapsa marina TaxID=424902 RepID=A0A5M8FP68_9GAMM|nr:SLC13 family permease [Thiohalocapsa marina]KAA6186688.1 TRAP transporter large permease subunit [Thiohalocapsa marina]
MTLDLILVLLLLGTAVLMFAINRPPADAVAMLMMLALPFTGVISVQESLVGFSNPNIILIAAMFVIGDALARTGVARSIGDWITRHAGNSRWRLLVMLMLAVGLLGSTMSTTGVVAIFIPIVLRIASQQGLAPGQLMMPMAYAALISGMMTLVATSSNLVVNYELTRTGADGFHFFSFTAFGLPILLVATLYMLLAQRWLRPADSTSARRRHRPNLMQWVERYRLAEREYRVRVRPDSPLLGKTLRELDLTRTTGIRIILIERGVGRSRQLLRRRPKRMLQAGDVLLIDVDLERTQLDLDEMGRRYGVDILPQTGRYFVDKSQAVGMLEVMIPESSRFIGKTVAEAEQLTGYELTVVGMRRASEALEPHGLREQRIQVGDTVLLAGPWKTIRRLQGETGDLIVLNLPRELDEYLPGAKRAPYAVLTLLLVVVLMATGVVANVQAALIGCVLMVFFRCISLEKAYKSIQLKTLVLIVGMMPFALALERTGGVTMAADALTYAVGDAGPYAVMALLFAITVVLGLFIVNTANALLLAPVGLAVAEALGASPYPFAMIIALAASTGFMTPISPVNTMVATAGNYRFVDFIRIGLPLTLLTMAISVLMVPWLLPLY